MEEKINLLKTIEKSFLLPDEANVGLIEKTPNLTDDQAKKINRLLTWERELSEKNQDKITLQVLTLIKELTDIFADKNNMV